MLTKKLNVTLNIIHNVNEEFLQNLLSLKYSNLTNIQKEVLNGVMNAIAELKNNDMMAVNIVKLPLLMSVTGQKNFPKGQMQIQFASKVLNK